MDVKAGEAKTAFRDPLSVIQSDASVSSAKTMNTQGHGEAADNGSNDGWFGEIDNEEDNYHSSSTTNSYRDEWFRLFEQDDFMEVVKQEGKKGRLRSSRFRSVCWKLYLESLPEERVSWVKVTRESRKKYEGLREKHIHSTKEGLRDTELDPTLNNPLSQVEESPWNRFFQDKDCRMEITQDVVRCFPEIAFFKSEKIREMMIDILFCYAKEHTHILYKQGMHELLAPLMFVLHCDHQAFLHAKEMESQLDIVSELMNPEYLEHDSYILFCHLMETTEPWFQHGQDYPSTKGLGFVHSEPFAKPEEYNPSSPLVRKLNRIKEIILKKHDFELYTHLNRLDIQPQIYGIRWLRLLFGREFTFQDLIVLWDAIFADSVMLDLVDYIFVAMLIKIRELLLTADYASSLMLLMRYPTVDDIHYLLNKSLYLRDSKNNPRQPNYQFKIYSQVRSGNVVSTSRGNLTVSGPPKKPIQVSAVAKKTSAVVTQGFNSLRRVGKTNRERGMPDRSKSKSTEDLPHPLAMTTDPVADVLKKDLKVISKTEGAESSYKTDKHSTSSQQSKIFSRPRSASKKETESEHYLAEAQSELAELQTMCRYCATNMEAHIQQMQSGLLQLNLETDDELFVSLAGLKQVRDLLTGKLRFTPGLIDTEPNQPITISDRHYSGEEDQGTQSNHNNNTSSNPDALCADPSSQSDVQLPLGSYVIGPSSEKDVVDAPIRNGGRGVHLDSIVRDQPEKTDAFSNSHPLFEP